MEDDIKSVMKPLPAYLEPLRMSQSLETYRTRPKDIVRLLRSLAHAMQYEHRLQDGPVWEALFDGSTELHDLARKIEHLLEGEDETKS